MISDKELSLVSCFAYMVNDKGGKEKVNNSLTNLGYSKIELIGDSKKETECIICERGEDILIAYCGTNSLREAVFTDARFRSTKTPMGRIYKGVWKTFNKNKKTLLSNIRDRKSLKDNYCLNITGHSLGSMLGQCMAAWIAFNNLAVVHNCVTFGGTRIMKRSAYKIFKKLLDDKMVERCVLYRHERDRVTRFPFRFMGYRHIGELYYIDTNGNIIKNPSRRYLVRDYIEDASQFPSIAKAIIDSFKDHNKVEGYYKNI